MQIQKVKTFHGLKWAVVDSFEVKYKDGSTSTHLFPVEYSTQQKTPTGKILKDTKVAIFPLTQDGFEKAMKLREELR